MHILHCLIVQILVLNNNRMLKVYSADSFNDDAFCQIAGRTSPGCVIISNHVRAESGYISGIISRRSCQREAGSQKCGHAVIPSGPSPGDHVSAKQEVRSSAEKQFRSS